MLNEFSILKECKNPDILVVTPLLPDHSISKVTKKTIKRNDIKYFWISSAGHNNIAKNLFFGLDWYRNKFGKLPPYYIMIDRDIELGRYMLDRLYKKLSQRPENIGYCYATFEFKGHINSQFPAIPFDINRLLNANYISSNSLFRSILISKVGLVMDDKYKRLLDYAFLIKLFTNGFVGVPEPNAWFIANSTKDDISAGSNNDYQTKYNRVYTDFIQPLLKKT